MRRLGFLIWMLAALVAKPVYGAEPTVQATGLVFSNITCTSAQINWTNGNGAWRIVLIKEASAVDAVPVDNVKYTSNPMFGSGSQIGTGNYVGFSSITNGFIVTKLKQNTVYHVAVFEHDGLNPDYLTTTPAIGSFTTQDLKMSFTFSRTDSCQGTNVVRFTNTSTANFGGIKYTWLFKDGKTDTGFNVTHTYMNGGSFSVELLASPSGGCANSYISPVDVLIIPRPVSKPIEKNGDTAQCFTGNHFYFNDQTTLAPVKKTGYVRTWYFTSTDTATFPTPDRVYPNPGKYRIFFKSETLYDNKKTGCTDTTSLYIRVIADPSSGVTVNDSIQCLAGNSFDFNNVYPGLVSFDWDFGDGGSSSTKNSVHTYSNVGTYQVIHRAASAEGCSSKDTIPVLVKMNKLASFTGLPPSVCESANPIQLKGSAPDGSFYGQYVTDSTFLPSTPGNYYVKYVVPDTFCPDSIYKLIVVQSLPRFTLGNDTNICNGGLLTLNVSAPGTVLWEDGSTNKSRTVSLAGTYTAVADTLGCKWTDSIEVFLGSTPVISLPSDTLLCKGALLKLVAKWPGSNILWNTGNTDTVQYVSGPGLYSVNVSNPCGSATDDVIVNYQNENCDVFVPTAFTPNGDNKNEVFTIVGRGNITPVIFQIYDRWGEKVFDSKESNSFAWDGTHDGQNCIDGMYSYIFYYEVPTGNIKRRATIKGSVLLYR